MFYTVLLITTGWYDIVYSLLRPWIRFSACVVTRQGLVFSLYLYPLYHYFVYDYVSIIFHPVEIYLFRSNNQLIIHPIPHNGP